MRRFTHISIRLLTPLLLISTMGLVHAQNISFEVGFDSTLLSDENEAPSNASNISFVKGFQEDGIRVEDGDILQYSITDNIVSNQGSITLLVKPNWVPGDTLRRILVVESSPVFELHVDESASLVFAMFSDQIETKIAAGNVSGWNKGDWHFLGFNWSSDKIEIFVDGSKIAETVVGFEIPDFGTEVFSIGSLAGTAPFNGILDEIKIYDAPLTSMQLSEQYKMDLSGMPAIRILDIFERDITQLGITLVDWEGPVRNPAMKYMVQGNESLSYPLVVTLSTNEENTSFSMPSTISQAGPLKTIVLHSKDSLESFLFSFYMDEDFADGSFDLTLSYSLDGIAVEQSIPVIVIDQDFDRPLSYPVIVDFSEARHPLMVAPETQAVIIQAAEDWLYYVDGEGMDEIAVGESFMTVGGNDHFFEEKKVSNPVPYTGFYLFAYGNSNAGPCVCSTGGPNRELLQTRNGEVVPIFRIGALHLNVFGQAYETEPTGWEILSPFENWTLTHPDGTHIATSDIYELVKHEIGHAMVFENSPLFLEAQGRDPGNPHPDESVEPIPNGFRSPALSAYYPDEVVPLFPNALSHVIAVLDPASQVPPYGGGVPVEVMPGGRQMLTKLDILIMESVGYPIRDNQVTKVLSITSDDAFSGEVTKNFEANLIADGGIPVYDHKLTSGSMPTGLSLDRRTGRISGIPEEEGDFPVTFEVKDYDERSVGASFSTTIRIGISLSSDAELVSFTFDSSLLMFESFIDTATRTIHFKVDQGTDVSNLTPLLEISEGATISPSADSSQDFTNPVSYMITSEDGTVSVIWTIIFDVVLAVDDLANQLISIYPNPADKELVVEKLQQSGLPSKLQLFNIQGQLMRTTYLSSKRVRIPLQDISPGIYFLQVIAKNGNNYTHKLAIEH